MDIPTDQDEQIAMLIECLRRWRCLLVLDDAEGILSDEGRAGRGTKTEEAYNKFFTQVATSKHQSCLLVLTNEQFQGIEHLAGRGGATVQSMRLSALSHDASRTLLRGRGLNADDATLDRAAQRISCHPLGLLDTAHIAKTLFAGDVAAFLAADMPISGSTRTLFDKQFARFSALEIEILSTLAQAQRPLAWDALKASLTSAPPVQESMDALLLLMRRSLVETDLEGLYVSGLVMNFMKHRAVA